MTEPVLCCITAQRSCLAILRKGKEMADRLDCPLKAVSVQPFHAAAEVRSAALIQLEFLTKESGAEIDVIYSDNPLLALAEYIEKEPPIHIFTGKQAEDGSFVMTLARHCGLPVSMVWGDTVFTLPNQD